MSKDKALETLVDEVKIPMRDVLLLEAEDQWREVSQKGLHRVDGNHPVVIVQGSEVMAITSAKRLRDEILPRSWGGRLADRVGHLAPPPEVMGSTKVVALGFLVQEVPKVDWLLVRGTGLPVGVLSGDVVRGFMPPAEMISKGPVYRGARIRLWGDSDVNVYYYCQVERRRYGPHAVYPDVEGRMRDRKGHLVEKRVYSEDF